MPTYLFTQAYFFLKPSADDSLPRVVPDDADAVKSYSYKAVPIGRKPPVFRNAMLDWQRERGIAPMTPPPDVLFYGALPLVRQSIANRLADFDIPNLVMQPVIYIDHEDKPHEDYWFLTFTDKLDSLNEKLLQQTPFSARRFFMTCDTTDGILTAHESLADLFRVRGVEVIPLPNPLPEGEGAKHCSGEGRCGH
jgi:hypothetical protein